MMTVDDAGRLLPPDETNHATGRVQPIPARPDRGRARDPFDQEDLIRRRLELRRQDPDVGGADWLLALIPAMVGTIDSAEWSGPPALLARFLETNLGPLPPRLADPANLVTMLHRARPTLQSWGYSIRIEPDREGGEIISIDGISGRVPG